MKPEELHEEANGSAKRGKLASDVKLIGKPVLITTAAVMGIAAIIFIVLFVMGDEEIPEFLQRWEQIVESGDVQSYEAICSDEFKEKFKGLYEDNRNLVAEKEVEVSIEDEDIETVRLDDGHYIVKHIPMSLLGSGVQTHQELYLKRNGLISRRWMIDREGYHYSRATQEELKQMVEEEPAEASEPLSEPAETPRDTEFVIRQTLEVWRTAWENKDLDGYIDCYADYADINRVTVVAGKEKHIKLTKSELRDHLERLSKKYSKIQVNIWQPLIIKGDVAVARANFLQEYSAWGRSDKGPVYQDIGMKELQFVKHDVEWKITNENWRLYEDVPVYPEREL